MEDSAIRGAVSARIDRGVVQSECPGRRGRPPGRSGRRLLDGTRGLAAARDATPAQIGKAAEIGLDMSEHYKENSLDGLAVNVVED